MIKSKLKNLFGITISTLCLIAVPLQSRADTDCPEMVVIHAGSFEMGSPKTNAGRKPVEIPGGTMLGGTSMLFSIIPPPKLGSKETLQVKIAKPFAMCTTEVTQGQWRAIMGSNPSEFYKCGSDCPVENVSWNEAKEFIKRLNARTGKLYRLPSEQEWAYACQAGMKSEYCGSENIDSSAWYQGNANSTTHPVSTKRSNAWGIYDMSGNVWEWVEDCWHEDFKGAPTNGSAWIGDGDNRVVRGGSWYSDAQSTQGARRFGFSQNGRSNNIGFRLVKTIQ
ncbi:MAG: formylglycine-generating enzyme family protein [Nitrosomonadales bacterium]|nr:formylglycine-generating enzyme family protein [Nitrosomonadales bacterium]